VADEVCEVIRLKAAELGIGFGCDVDRNIGDIDADLKAVRSLLINLVENAMDACRVDTKKKDHQVRLKLRGYPEHIEYEVEDNGIGMDQETRERAFTLFFSSKSGNGTGLGLFISNKIAQAHGGEITIDSELNKGTRMIVKLPRKPPSAGTKAAKT
jgi:signal transduction histidine kinase